MKKSRIVKYHEGDKYIFIGGRAIVPNMLISNKSVIITLKEFNTLTRKSKKMNESIKQILMRRDNISSDQAEDIISQATDALFDYIDEDDQDAAENVCMEYFGLEPDYLIELF